MKHLRKCTALLLAVLMVFALAACGQKDDTAAVDKDLTVNVVSLNGTTGFGMAKLMSDSKAGSAALNYNFTVETDPSNATAALVNGTADIAALPTNAAAALYNKTNGAVQVLALNTRGVLYVVTDGTENITSFADLRGKTVYVPVQNPTFIFQYLCEKNGLTAGTDEYKQAVIDAIKTMDGVKGITGSYSFDSDNNPIKSVAIIGLTGGEEVFKEMF